MKEYIEERAIEIANYIIETNATVRQTAKKFRVSKSTVHKDVTERLLQINPSLAMEARKYLIGTSRNGISGVGLPPEKNICIWSNNKNVRDMKSVSHVLRKMPASYICLL